MGSALNMLNVVNGILFVQISQQDIDKAEIEKRQKEHSPDSGEAVAIAEKDTKKDDILFYFLCLFM